MTHELPPTRRAILRQYVFALFAEGHFTGVKSPAAMAAKAAKVFAGDLPMVIAEIGSMTAQAAGNHLSAALIGKVTDILGDVERRGVKAVWSDIQAVYRRGVDAKHGTR